MDEAAVKSTFAAFAVQVSHFQITFLVLYELLQLHACVEGVTATQTADTNNINNKNFSKLCKDCKVIGQKCTSTDIDIVFSKVK